MTPPSISVAHCLRQGAKLSRSGILVGQERAEQFVIRTERAPTGWGGGGEKRVADLPDTLFMRFRGVGGPKTKRLGNLEAVCVVQHGGPALGKAFAQFAHELSAHQARELLALLRLGEQRTEHLHPRDVVLAKLLCQRDQRGGGTRLGKGGE